MAISPQQLKIYLTSAHRAVIFAIAQLSCLEHIRTKFGTETRNNVQKTVLPSDFTSEKIQNGGRRHFKNWSKGYISDNMAYIYMKFCKRTKNGVPQSILL